MIRKCFTVNPHRTIEEINSYEVLLKEGIYQGVEIFFPYQKTKEQQEIYLNGIKTYLKYNPDTFDGTLGNSFKASFANSYLSFSLNK